MAWGDKLSPAKQDLPTAVTNAIKFFAGAREPFALLWLAVMHRRFGIEEFADALRRFDEVLAEQPKQLPLLRAFRRIAGYDNLSNAAMSNENLRTVTDVKLEAAAFLNLAGQGARVDGVLARYDLGAAAPLAREIGF